MKRLLFISYCICAVITLQAQTQDTAFVEVDGTQLHTVLTTPESGDEYPLAIIIAGSGPTDLNGNQPTATNNSLLFLSDALVNQGIATLRFDKRGIANSSYAEFTEDQLTIDLYANDVVHLIHYAQQKGFEDIHVIGHSEGALLGLIALQEVGVNGFVSLCGAGQSADLVLKKQMRAKLPDKIYEQVEGKIDSLKRGERVNDVPPYLYALFRPAIQTYLMSWFRYTPAELFGRLDCPRLIVHAENDLQVYKEEAQLLKGAAKEAKMVEIKKMNHVLKDVEDNQVANLAAYRNRDLPVNETLVNHLVEFIK